MRFAWGAVLFLASSVVGEVLFKEDFSGDWESRWVKSTNKESEGTQGKWEVAAGKFYADAEADKGLRTTEDARFYQISSKLDKAFSNKGRDLVLSYSVKHEQSIDCGGGYIKLHPSSGFDQENYNGDTPYNVMFGPDICGSSTRRVHLIFNYKGENYLINKEIRCETDEFTHTYTLVLRPDNTYEVFVDGESRQAGSLEEDWDMLPPKQIKDPNASKPEDWVDDKMIADPEDKKPEGYDDIPAEIPDPDAEKPEDWDDDLDGEYETPMIANPDYQGPWQPRMIENPDYKGPWVHPMVDNPEFASDDSLYLYEDNAGVGFELWQVKSGTIFDNIVVADSLDDVAEATARATAAREAEKEAEEKEAEERRQREEEERKAREAEEEAAEDDADEEDEDDEGKDEL